MESRHVKSINTDKRSKKKIKFASARERAKRASADVYRSHKRKIGATSSATREDAVHNPTRGYGGQKRQRALHLPLDDGKKISLVTTVKTKDTTNDLLEINSSLASELDETLDRNASEIFGKFHRLLWPLVRSLPEILHHSEKIVTLMLSYMLSPEKSPELPSDIVSDEENLSYIVNHATMDILHLMSILARDLRHEIHPFLDKILKRIIYDLLNPPSPPRESGKQPIPLDVSMVETSFRSLAYIFRYDAEYIAKDIEAMRKFYGVTLGAKRELVRRLAAETFAPLIRRLGTQIERQRHLKRIFKALAVASTVSPVTPSIRRTQDDTVDGISQLLFQTVRGVRGKLHSQGLMTIQFVIKYCAKSSEVEKERDLILDLSIAVIHRLLRYLSNDGKELIINSITLLLGETLSSHFDTKSTQGSVLSVLKIFSSATESILESSSIFGSKSYPMMSCHSSLNELFSFQFFKNLSYNQRGIVVKLVCPILVSLQSTVDFDMHLETWLRCLMKIDTNQSIEDESHSIRDLTGILSRDLLPHLEDNQCVQVMGSAMLTAASTIIEYDAASALLVVFAIASHSSNTNERLDDPSSGTLFQLGTKASFQISEDVQNKLLSLCVSSEESSSQKEVERTLIAMRCIPLIASLSSTVEIGKAGKERHRVSIQFYIDSFVSMERKRSRIDVGGDTKHLDLLQALSLEGLSCLGVYLFEIEQNTSDIDKDLARLLPSVENLVHSNPNSAWILRGAASFVQLISKYNLRLSTKVDETFDSLVQNLSSPCHALRLHTLDLLASFPIKNFVVDHADLDLDGDLDEEQGHIPEGSGKHRGPTGKCNLIETLRHIESMKVQLAKERLLLGAVSKVDVLSRSGKLPIVYAEAASHHMLGLFNVKFAPLWPSIEKTLVTLVLTYEQYTWPALERILVVTMESKFLLEEKEKSIPKEEGKPIGYADHLSACLEWQTSEGLSTRLFGEQHLPMDGEVARHVMTDRLTVMESVWKVAEKCQQLVAKHSRVFVPCFIRFLRNEYFFFHTDDAGARELSLQPTHDDATVDRKQLQKHHLQKKLVCFLRVFAAIDGPKQMIQHTFLEQIFRSFLTSQDMIVVKLSLTALLKFKLEYLTPYRELLFGILDKGRLRDALLDFQQAIDSGKIAREHRQRLIPVLCRLLFGQMSVRESRSSKDSPAARRSAILSFVSQLCEQESELMPFIYLMIRNFAPSEIFSLQEFETYSHENILVLLKSFEGLDAKKLHLQGSVIEGFLQLLKPVVSQLGHRIESCIPALFSIVLSLCQLVAIVDRSELTERQKIEEKSIEDERSRELRSGAIRGLCYHRLSEIFSLFAESIDFNQWNQQLWTALEGSVKLLPEMVMKSEHTPALLHLMETISSHRQLRVLIFSFEPSITSIFNCIASSSLPAVMNSVLSIIDALLEDILSTEKSEKRSVFVSYIPLLMERFTTRFKGCDEPTQGMPQLVKRKRVKLRQATWRKELRILCQVSQLLDDNMAVNGDSLILEELCHLLLPFLESDQGTSDDDKLDVIGILKGIVKRSSRGCQMLTFDSVSFVLGPNKGKSGIDSITVRSEISNLIKIVGDEVPSILGIAKKVKKMSSINSKRVDEVDFETIIPELNTLGCSDRHCEWERLGKEAPLNLASIVNICFHYLHSEDGVLARASFSAIKSLVSVAATRQNLDWTKLVESLIVPLSRSGLQARSVSIRRYYVLIIRETARCFRDFDSPNLCGDLTSLIDDENPDLDFFIGITHVQIHRRGRAFQRLRRFLRENEESASTLTSQSLSSVLLPLALHPAYESKTRAEESFTLESIATLGAISRRLPWNKYHNVIQSILSSFDRHPDQERYLIGSLCAIIDALSFDLVSFNESTKTEEESAVWRALERRIIPKIEALMTKEKTDKSGSRTKVIRPSIVLALVKLFQKFPTTFFESKLPRILAVMCNALRDKDSNARDLARATMAKIVVGLDLKYLSDVIRELAITLKEGYKLHVRSATLHTILQELISVYKPSVSTDDSEGLQASFDASVPAMMDMLQEDIFGEAHERRESQETSVRYVKEAGGKKGVHSIEMLCRLIRFKPSDARHGKLARSGVHCIVSPLLERLRSSNVTATTIRKIKEILNRVVVGLSNNPSLHRDELFPFVYATILPFVDSQLIISVLDDESDEDEDDVLKVSGAKEEKKAKMTPKMSVKVAEWRPSTLNHVDSSREAIDLKKKSREDLRSVKDGSSAPKLTGSSRHGKLDVADAPGLNDPATVGAVVFGLSLLQTSLKKLNLDSSDDGLVGMMDPFVPMLTACTCNCKDDEVALLAMKCLMSFLRFRLPSFGKCSKSLGSQALLFLSSSGSSLNQESDMTQASFRTLTYLINRDHDNTSNEHTMLSGAEGEEVFAANATLPLTGEQMRVLIAFLTVSIAESDQHNPALGLIKAIMSRKYMSPEFYDLMESMLKLNVRSQKASLRQQSAGIFARYLLDYPMSDERFEKHLKQVIANISYEYKDGRLSAIQLLTLVSEKLPDALLERHAQLLFLPQVLQLVNDDRKECREAVSKCLSTLLSRSSTEVLQSFHKYTLRWCTGEGPMRVASLQVFCIFAEAAREFVRPLAPAWLQRLSEMLETPSLEAWEVPYFSLVCLEKLAKLDFSLFEDQTELWACVVERLADSHPWIKLASCRLVHGLLASRAIPKPFEASSGMLFDVTRNLCFQMNVDEEEQNEDLSEMAIKALTLVLPLTQKRPDLCFEADSPHAGLRDPVAWLLRRLSSIAKPKGRQRRMGVYKCFAAFCKVHPEIVLTGSDPSTTNKTNHLLYLELMLEPLYRSDREATNETEKSVGSTMLPQKNVMDADMEAVEMTESSLARDVLQMIEEGCLSEDFLTAFAAVKSRARDKKEQRKSLVKAEAVQDPMAAALRKAKKHERERGRKKRRVEDRRHDRGASKKRRNMS